MKQKTIERITIGSLWAELMAAVLTIVSILKAPFGATILTYAMMAIMFAALTVFLIMENKLDKEDEEMG